MGWVGSGTHHVVVVVIVVPFLPLYVVTDFTLLLIAIAIAITVIISLPLLRVVGAAGRLDPLGAAPLGYCTPITQSAAQSKGIMVPAQNVPQF